MTETQFINSEGRFAEHYDTSGLPSSDEHSTQFALHTSSSNFTLGRVGWYLLKDVATIDKALQAEVLHTLASEAIQEPPDLVPLTVDMTRRFQAVLMHENNRFYVGSIAITLFLAIAYVCLPCSVPTNHELFILTNRVLYTICAASCQAALAMVFLGKEFITRMRLEFFIMVALEVGQDALKTTYLSGASWFTGFWLEIFNATNWMFMVLIFVYWAWPNADATVLVQFACSVLLYYVYICVLEVVALQISQLAANRLLQSFFFVVFFMWCTFCQRIMQSLARRITIGMARVAQRPVDWYDLLRGQCFLFLAYIMQGTYYRLIFVEVDAWQVQIVLISMHVLQELLLYPLRMLPRIRERERWFLSRSSIGLRILSPVLPMSLWIDLHYLDYFMRKVAELSTLLLFAARCILCRYGPWIRECYTPRTWAKDEFRQLLVLSGVLFVCELLSTVISQYFMRGERRGFVVRAVAFSTHLRVVFGLCVIVANCSVTFSDALKHVKFAG